MQGKTTTQNQITRTTYSFVEEDLSKVIFENTWNPDSDGLVINPPILDKAEAVFLPG